MAKETMPKISQKKQIELDLTCKSLIGKNIKIIDSTNPKQIGIEGILVYESAKILHIKTDDKIKKIFKNTITFQTDYKSQKVNIKGSALFGTLVQRIKKIK
jgi:RNase P/RNase MRP subunit p29